MTAPSLSWAKRHHVRLKGPRDGALRSHRWLAWCVVKADGQQFTYAGFGTTADAALLDLANNAGLPAPKE